MRNMQHKFSLGEHVVLTQGFRSGAARGDYDIMALLPPDHLGPRYRLRGVNGTSAALEGQLSLTSKDQGAFGGR